MELKTKTTAYLQIQITICTDSLTRAFALLKSLFRMFSPTCESNIGQTLIFA